MVVCRSSSAPTSELRLTHRDTPLRPCPPGRVHNAKNVKNVCNVKYLDLAAPGASLLGMALRQSPRLTPALLAANRANARHSTGPRTPAGGARVALNPLRHGRYARGGARKAAAGGAIGGGQDL
jgi:hypothetical protein